MKPIYSMSKMGGCARTLSADQLGLIPKGGRNLALELAAREGRRHEVFIREDLIEHGYKTLSPNGNPNCPTCGRDGFHTEIDMPNFKLVGHIDDFVVHETSNQVFMAEYKALGKFTHDRLTLKGVGLHRVYSTQLTLYHASIKERTPIIWVLKSRDSGKLTIYPMEEAPGDLDEILERVEIITEFVNKGELAPCDADPTMLDDFSCTSLCSDEKTRLVVASATTPARVKVAAESYINLLDLETQLDQAKISARSVLEAYAGLTGATSVLLDGLRITKVAETEYKKYNIPNDVKELYAARAIKKGYFILKRI